MSAHNCLRSDNQQGPSPVTPDPGQPDPKPAIHPSQPGSRTLSFRHRQPLAKARFSRAISRTLPGSSSIRNSEERSSNIGYRAGDGLDSPGGAGQITDKLLNGTIMMSPEEAKIEITNRSLGTTITLDFTDQAHPRRFDSQTREFEVAGFNNEVWLDFEYAGLSEGDVCRPFSKLGGAVAAVTDGGVIRIVLGATPERGTIGGGKSFKLVAPIGGVTIGTPNTKPLVTFEFRDAVSDRDVWVQFDWFDTTLNHVPYLFHSITQAMDVVAEGGVIHIEPGSTPERLTIGSGKRFTLVAPIGGVTIPTPSLLPASTVFTRYAPAGHRN
jgi:hypothetical protein